MIFETASLPLLINDSLFLTAPSLQGASPRKDSQTTESTESTSKKGKKTQKSPKPSNIMVFVIFFEIFG